MISRRPVLAIAAMIVAVVLAACGSAAATPSPTAALTAAPTDAPSEPPASTAPAHLTIYGAASLAKVLDKVKADYEAANPGTTVTISTDSSAALATQIQEGAPADVFLSADETNPKKLVDGGLADGAAVVFAANKLTIITPTDNPGGVTGPFDIAKDGVRVVAAGDEVPLTKYTTQLVTDLAGSADAPAGFAAAYAANIVSKEDNVAAVRAKIELGEGDAAIVYVTDAKASDKVSRIDVPDDVNVPASYAGVVVNASPSVEAAHAFLDWFAGPDGQAILAQFGFLPPAS